MAASQMTFHNLVGGDLTEAAEETTYAVVNPATEQEIAVVPKSSAIDVDRAVTAACSAISGAFDSTPAQRAELLLNLAEVIVVNRCELAEIESRNVGKPLQMALGEMDICVDNLKFFAGAARILEGKSAGEYLSGYTSFVRREPVGVVGQIVPWNYPLMMAVWKIAPALAAGNTVVLKPAEETPLSILRLSELAAEIIPPGVLNVLSGGDETGEAIVAHPNVDMVALTGGTATGRAVSGSAAGTLKRLHLELGGKAPVVVLGDADLDAVAQTVRTMGYWNSGQECGSACRVLATNDTYEPLLEKLVPAVESIRVGDPSEDSGVEMGPVVSRTHEQRVLGFLDRIDQGTIIVGGSGQSRKGYFVDPTVVINVDQSHEIVQREVFGPVVTVQRCEDEVEAIRWANDVEYGLAASVWTQNISSAHSAIRALRFGTVWVNDHLPFVSEMPWGGVKQSGYGHDLSAYSLEDYTILKHAMVKFA